MFNALMLSYARVPYALAQDGLLPRFLTRTTPHVPTGPGSLGLRAGLRRRMGVGAWPLLRAAHLHRPRPLRCIPFA